MVNTANADLKYKNRTYTRTLFITIDNTVILIPKTCLGFTILYIQFE